MGFSDISKKLSSSNLSSSSSSVPPQSPPDSEETENIPIHVQQPTSFLGVTPHVVRRQDYSVHSSETPRKFWMRFGGIFVGSVIVLVLVMTFIFDRAVVAVETRSQTVPVSLDLSAASETSSDQDLRFETMTVSQNVTRSVVADGIDMIGNKASGSIVIFNKEAQPQRFREETRFATAEGLVFKLPKGPGITVPAAVGGVPGSVEAVVYAAEPGVAYNIALSDFVIPGWKEIDDKRFSTQYARSKTVMTGGSSEGQPRVSQSVLAAVTEEMKKELIDTLTKKILVEAPKDMLVFADTFLVQTQTPVITAGDKKEEAQVTLTGSVIAPLLQRANFTQVLVSKLLTSEEKAMLGSSFTIHNEDALRVNIADISLLANNVQPSMMPLHITAEALTLQGTVTATTLQEKLQGQKISATQDIFALEPTIAKASVHMRPFWKSSFPKQKERIHIEMKAVGEI